MSELMDIYLVIGGSGFLGRHVVQKLLDRGDNVSVFDLVQRYDDVPFYTGDITDEESISSALRRSGTTCIIHTASPVAGLKNPEIYWKVNVQGTKTVIAAAIAHGVRKLVFTSSAGVIFNGADVADVDERVPYPEVPMDAYNESKAKAEVAVLEANGKEGLMTVALRPASIFGPGDRQLMSGLYQVYEREQTHFQIGDNTNLFDWTYVENVAHAHILAADKLDKSPPNCTSSNLEKRADSNDVIISEREILEYPLPSITLTTGEHRVPTCKARPLGPYLSLPQDWEHIQAAFDDPTHPESNRPVIRTRFDQFSSACLVKAKSYSPENNPLQVAGQAFFISNGEPIYFWDFMRYVWHHLDAYFPNKRKPRGLVVLPKTLGMAAASASEWLGWLTGKEPTFTRFRVTFSCATRWHNIEKARRILGYEPQVGIEDGVKKMIEWWYSEYTNGNHTTRH